MKARNISVTLEEDAIKAVKILGEEVKELFK